MAGKRKYPTLEEFGDLQQEFDGFKEVFEKFRTNEFGHFRRNIYLCFSGIWITVVAAFIVDRLV